MDTHTLGVLIYLISNLILTIGYRIYLGERMHILDYLVGLCIASILIVIVIVIEIFESWDWKI